MAIKRRHFQIAALVAGSLIFGSACFFAGIVAGRSHWTADHPIHVPRLAFEGVLDGDTIVDQGRAVHIRGLDAPELGPWAKCWAEAALAGEAKFELENSDGERGWRVVELKQVATDRWSGRVIDREGYDIADELRVAGTGAMSEKRWDWCGQSIKLEPVGMDETLPIGPQLWWPSERVFDPRAND